MAILIIFIERHTVEIHFKSASACVRVREKEMMLPQTERQHLQLSG